MSRAGLRADRLIAWGLPASVGWLAVLIALGPAAGAAHWALWCVLSTVVSLSQPAVAQAFPLALAGRALSAFNLVLFAGVFVVQWGIGLAIDAFGALGVGRVASFQLATAAFCVCCAAAWGWFGWCMRRMPIIATGSPAR
jgi:hypothetical protein